MSDEERNQTNLLWRAIHVNSRAHRDANERRFLAKLSDLTDRHCAGKFRRLGTHGWRLTVGNKTVDCWPRTLKWCPTGTSEYHTGWRNMLAYLGIPEER